MEYAKNRRVGFAVAFAISLSLAVLSCTAPSIGGEREYNGWYSGDHLNRVAFPLGGIGAGMVCLEGTGALSHVSVRNRMEAFEEPCLFSALCVKGREGNVAKVLEGPVPGWKIFGRPGTGNGASGTSYGLPRFASARFLARFPFATVRLEDPGMPLDVEITAWSPFVPGRADDSSLPLAALEYTFTNPGGEAVEAVFSCNTKNFMASGGSGDGVLPIDGGFVLHQGGSPEHPEREGGFAIFVKDEEAVVDHCWFKGGWWDALTLAWENISAARLVDNPPAKGKCPGASLFVPVAVPPGGSKTVRLLMAWYVPRTTLSYGKDQSCESGPAFGHGPVKGTARNQQKVTGYEGSGFVNSFYPCGDCLTGTLTSLPFTVTRKKIRFLLGGGDNPGKACVNLLIDGAVVRTATGKNMEKLEPAAWDVEEFAGKEAVFQVVDDASGSWGHINVDSVVMTDGAAAAEDAVVLGDFEGADFDGWVDKGPAGCGNNCDALDCSEEARYHVPWYAGRFDSLSALCASWNKRYGALRKDSALFRDAFYDTTLPPEVVEAAAANLTILKSPTVMRQKDGRLWCWEGCCDERGCCAGSCTHVWNYAQALCHLFPDLERSLRATEFNESQDRRGHQTFRSCLPIRPVAHTYHAASDGQLGGVMKVHREWRNSGDGGWLRAIWPQVKQSLDYCIGAWDPRRRGVLEEPHHNTYDIEYWGPDGHCTSFYLGALEAAIRMGGALGDDVSLYEELLGRGREYLESHLFNGEYFFQEIRTEGLDATFRPLDASGNGAGYGDIVAALNEQGPKYQYGTGCLSDGVLGFWIARMCGLGQIVDGEKVRSSLAAIHRHNFKPDLSNHANPQRPSYACGGEGGLLLCTWPRGGRLSIPFVYSDEVWTGIEYQVASHLMIEGLVDEGLEIVRACRDRYDGRVRNPFDEYECGHWYARAMASYGLLQGLTGVRYDAVEKCLFIDPRQEGDFRSFLATATGFAVVGIAGGRPFVDVRMGEIVIDRIDLYPVSKTDPAEEKQSFAGSDV
jgi:uncharacterized protein (DUF608 family)